MEWVVFEGDQSILPTRINWTMPLKMFIDLSPITQMHELLASPGGNCRAVRSPTSDNGSTPLTSARGRPPGVLSEVCLSGLKAAAPVDAAVDSCTQQLHVHESFAPRSGMQIYSCVFFLLCSRERDINWFSVLFLNSKA